LVQEALGRQMSRLGKKMDSDSYKEEAIQSIEKAESLDSSSEIIRENAKRIRSLKT